MWSAIKRTSVHEPRLGPLERVDGRWGIGDRGPHGDWNWLEFREDALHEHVSGGEGRVVPWGRIMEFGVLRPPFLGSVHLTLRHPYEPFHARYDLHARRYGAQEYLFLRYLLGQTAEAHETQRLGDPDWLARVIERLPTERVWTWRRLDEAVASARHT